MDILKEWSKRPPSEPMTSMPALWHDFKKRRDDPRSPVCTLRDNIPDACALDRSPENAMRRAVRGVRPNGKMHNHQVKVIPALPRFEDKMIANLPSIVLCASFNELYFMIDILKTKGIGPVTVYDTAVRFGAWLELKPEKIYIHAGTKLGLKALGIRVDAFDKTVPMEMLPPILRRKDPDEVEDFLCTYRHAFEMLKTEHV